MNRITDASSLSLLACDEGFDPIEDRLRANIRGTIEAVFKEELNGFLVRLRYGREAGATKGYRHGNRDRQPQFIIALAARHNVRLRVHITSLIAPPKTSRSPVWLRDAVKPT
jgi:hypothetical protein